MNYWRPIKEHGCDPLNDPGRIEPVIHLILASPWSGVSLWRSYVVYPQ